MLQVLPNFLFGVQATGNLGNARIKDMADFSYCKSMQVKPGGGLVAAYGINDKIAIRSGINFLQHGVRIKALTRKPPNDYPTKIYGPVIPALCKAVFNSNVICRPVLGDGPSPLHAKPALSYVTAVANRATAG